MRLSPQALCSRPLALGGVDWPDGTQTLIVKLTLKPTPAGALVLAADQPALQLDATGPYGELLEPSDFAPYKPQCDVVVIERQSADRAASGSLVVGSHVFRVVERDSLGPRELFCPAGDPTDGASRELWQQQGSDFSRFQSAQPERRIPYPSLPFDLSFRRGPHQFDWRFSGPAPRVYVVREGPDPVRTGGPLMLDTLVVDPEQESLTVLFRGRQRGLERGQTLVVDASWETEFRQATLASFVQSVISTPASAQSPRGASTRAPAEPDSGTRVSKEGEQFGPALPFAQPGPSPADTTGPSRFVAAQQPGPGDFSDQTVVATARSAAPTLPFQRSSAGRRLGAEPAPAPPNRALSSEELSQLRQASPVAFNPWTSDETRQLHAPSDLLTPSQPTEPPLGSGPIGLGGMRLGRPVPQVAPSAEPPVGSLRQTPDFSPATPVTSTPPRDRQAVATPPASEANSSSPESVYSAEQLRAIQLEVWKGEESLAKILARHGLDVAQWRSLNRGRGGQP